MFLFLNKTPCIFKFVKIFQRLRSFILPNCETPISILKFCLRKTQKIQENHDDQENKFNYFGGV